MHYAYSNGQHVGITNSLAMYRLQEQRPEWEWLSESEHKARQAGVQPQEAEQGYREQDAFSAFMVLGSIAGAFILIITALITKWTDQRKSTSYITPEFSGRVEK